MLRLQPYHGSHDSTTPANYYSTGDVSLPQLRLASQQSLLHSQIVHHIRLRSTICSSKLRLCTLIPHVSLRGER